MAAVSTSATPADDDGERRRQAALDAYAVVDTPPEQPFDDIVRLAVTLCDVPAAAISLIDHDRVWFKAQIGLDNPQVPRLHSICNHVILDPGHTLVARDMADDPLYARRRRINGQPPRFYAGVPLLSPDGLPLGAVCVMDLTPRELTHAQLEGLELLARQTCHLLELRRHVMEQRRLLSERDAVAQRAERARADLQQRHEALQESASRDPLTGLLNRTALRALLWDVDSRPPEDRPTYSLLLVDVDHFKRVNDQHGHLLGDQALRTVAAAISAAVRKDDVAVRYGGEEFLVVLPATDLAAAAEVAHRVREQVSLARLPFTLTVSVGVAHGEPGRDTPQQTFDRADQALYRAKATGRDRVVVDDTPRNVA